MDSGVRRLVNREGIHVEAAWVRKLRSTGRTVYSGVTAVQLSPEPRVRAYESSPSTQW
jgi:hypothetical protein